MKQFAKVLEETKGVKRPTNLHTEHQHYGVYLADTLEDPKHYSLYIKIAKNYPRVLIDEALIFVKGYPNAKSKGKLFMWKLKQLKNEIKVNL